MIQRYSGSGYQLTLAILEMGECTKAVELESENPIGMIKEFWAPDQAHRFTVQKLRSAFIESRQRLVHP